MSATSNLRFPPPPCYYQTARLLAEQGFVGTDPVSFCNGSRKPRSSSKDSAENTSRFHKTRMCLFHQKGACVKGSDCSYAHDTEELKAAPDLMKTRLCQDWLNGRCVSNKCKFAHGRNELRFTHNYYKTKICHFWQQGGCTKGVDCRHAHGEHELRPLPTEASVQRRASVYSAASSSLSGGSVDLIPQPAKTRRGKKTPSGRQAQVMEALRLAEEARKLAQKSVDLLGEGNEYFDQPVRSEMVFASGSPSQRDQRLSSYLTTPSLGNAQSPPAPLLPSLCSSYLSAPPQTSKRCPTPETGAPRLSFLSGCTTTDTVAEFDSLAETLTNLLLNTENEGNLFGLQSATADLTTAGDRLDDSQARAPKMPQDLIKDEFPLKHRVFR